MKKQTLNHKIDDIPTTPFPLDRHRNTVGIGDSIPRQGNAPTCSFRDFPSEQL